MEGKQSVIRHGEERDKVGEGRAGGRERKMSLDERKMGLEGKRERELCRREDDGK